MFLTVTGCINPIFFIEVISSSNFSLSNVDLGWKGFTSIFDTSISKIEFNFLAEINLLLFFESFSMVDRPLPRTCFFNALAIFNFL